MMFAPQTPPMSVSLQPTTSLHRTLSSSPQTSSPLAPPRSSPLDRLSVFKTAFHGHPRARQPLRRLSDNVDLPSNQAFDPFRKPRDDEPVKMLWRERLEQRCRARVANDRQKTRDRGRGLDGLEADVDMEEEPSDYLDDELIRRAVVADARRIQRSQELVYAREVGSSLDPDMEDIDALERALQEPDSEEPPQSDPSPPLSVIDDDETDPGELYDAYLADLAELEGDSDSSLPPSSPPRPPPSSPAPSEYADFDMDMDSIELDLLSDS